MKKWKRFLAAALVCLMTMSCLPVQADAASYPTLPDLSSFLGSRYTQNIYGEYSHYVTCIYDECEGTKPLEEFLELLQEDRYQLVLDGKSSAYQDSYSTGICTDYFFHYTGSSKAIKWIKLIDGTKYHVRVTLYTYPDKDYNAIVFYSDPDFRLKDSGVHYGDSEPEETAPPATTAPKETAQESGELPMPQDYFGTLAGTRRSTSHPRDIYTFASFSSFPTSKVDRYVDALESYGLVLAGSGVDDEGDTYRQLTWEGEAGVSIWWLKDSELLEVYIYDEVAENAPETVVTVTASDELPSVLAMKNGSKFTLSEYTALTESRRYSNAHFKADVEYSSLAEDYVEKLVSQYGYSIVENESKERSTWGMEEWYLSHPDSKVGAEDPLDHGADVHVKINRDYDDEKCTLSIQYVAGITLADTENGIGETISLKNGETEDVRESCIIRIKKGSTVTLHGTYDETNSYDRFEWYLADGSDVISMSATHRNCTVKGLTTGKAVISMTYSYSYEGTNILTGNRETKQGEKRSVYTIIVE